jgi:dolichol-phosphate mannosyltransferase
MSPKFRNNANKGENLLDNKQRFDVSVILPTYNEAENIRLIVPKIFEVLNAAQIKGELIISDDSSPDGTGDVAKELARKYPMQVLIRTANRGLSAAVLDGFGLSKAKTCVVMDADGSHPVESLPKMLRPLIENEADVAVGSRHTEGGAIGDWSIHRRIISKVAAMLSKGITMMSDPTTGFMAIKRELLDGLNLDPVGWKVVLEIVVKLSPRRMIEVPITFEDRQFGESKMSLKEQWNYLRHLYRLYKFKFPTVIEFIKFCIVGFYGTFVDMGVVIALKELFAVNTLICAIGGFIAAVTSNYFFNRYWSFEHGKNVPILKSYLIFVAVCCLGLIVRLIAMYMLIEYGKLDSGKWYIFTNFIGIVIASLVNFMGSKFLAFSPGSVAFKYNESEKEPDPVIK